MISSVYHVAYLFQSFTLGWHLCLIHWSTNGLNGSSKLRNMWECPHFFVSKLLGGLDEIGRDDAAKVLNCKHYFHSVACSCRGSAESWWCHYLFLLILLQKKFCTWMCTFCKLGFGFKKIPGGAGFLPSAVGWFMHHDSSSMVDFIRTAVDGRTLFFFRLQFNAVISDEKNNFPI